MPAAQADDGEEIAAPDRWAIPVLALAAGIGSLLVLAPGPFLPAMAAEFGVGVALLGQVPALTNLLAALLGLVVGPLADRYGQRRALLLGLLAAGVGAFSTGLAPSVGVLFGLVGAGALGQATLYPVAQAVAGTRFADDAQRRAVSWTMVGASGAFLAGVPLLTTVAAAWGWRAAFGLLAVLALVAGLLTWRVLGPDAAPPAGSPDRPGLLPAYRPLLCHRPTLGLVGGAVLAGVGQGAFFTYLGAFLVQQHGLTTQQVGWAYLAVGSASLTSRLAAGGRLGGAEPRPLIVTTRVAGALLLGGLLALPLPTLVGMGALTLGMVAIAFGTVMTAVVLVRETPGGRATTMTLNSTAYTLGTALGGALGGLLVGLSGFGALGWLVLAAYSAAAGLVWWSCPTGVPRRRPSWL